MILTPWVIFTSQAAPPAVDHSALWIALITPAVTLGLFYMTQREARRKDRQELDSHREKERETLRLTLKREVFLEVAPAIQNNYLALIAFVDLQLSIHDLQKKTQETIEQSAGAIAKLQAVAADETLEAARRVQTFLGATYIRLIAARGVLGEDKDLDAIKEITRIWRRETAAFPPLLASFIACAREELYLPFNREQFEAGLVDSNAQLFAELEKITGPQD